MAVLSTGGLVSAFTYVPPGLWEAKAAVHSRRCCRAESRQQLQIKQEGSINGTLEAANQADGEKGGPMMIKRRQRSEQQASCWGACRRC